MTLELLKSNIEREKDILKELAIFSQQLEQSMALGGNLKDRQLINETIKNLLIQLKILNAAIPSLLENIQFYQQLSLEDSKQNKDLLKVKFNAPETQEKIEAVIKKEHKIKFLESLAFWKSSKEKLKNQEPKEQNIDKSREDVMKTFSPYIRASNRFFRKPSDALITKGYFDGLNRELRKITSPFVIQSYVSLMLFSTALAFFIGLLPTLIFFMFGIPILGFISFMGFPMLTLILFLMYPSSQRKTLEKEINQELPFVTIYMDAIATSGIEPSRIFEIIVRTKDYPFTQREIKKLLNFINFYGYDLVGALRHSAKLSPSERLSMLFNGLATTISSGGQLTDFLSKHAETLLFDYRLEREKYTKVAETFMDIYISIVIAAPMIMMILFILITLTGYATSIPPSLLSVLIVAIVGLLNVGFITFLNLKQPKF